MSPAEVRVWNAPERSDPDGRLRQTCLAGSAVRGKVARGKDLRQSDQRLRRDLDVEQQASMTRAMRTGEGPRSRRQGDVLVMKMDRSLRGAMW